MERRQKFTSWVKEVTTPEWKDNSYNTTKPEWNERRSVKKGTIGERIVRYVLEKNGWVVYQCVSRDKAHVIDCIAYKEKKTQRFLEVKTKSFMRNPDRTGFNTCDLEVYTHYLKEKNQDIFILFVDQAKKKIYGNFLSKLIEPKEEDGMLFPNEFISKYDGKSITVFPLSSMIDIAELSEDQIKELKKYTKGE